MGFVSPKWLPVAIVSLLIADPNSNLVSPFSYVRVAADHFALNENPSNIFFSFQKGLGKFLKAGYALIISCDTFVQHFIVEPNPDWKPERVFPKLFVFSRTICSGQKLLYVQATSAQFEPCGNEWTCSNRQTSQTSLTYPDVWRCPWPSRLSQ